VRIFLTYYELTLIFRIEIEKCVYYDKNDKHHIFDDLICKECFMDDPRIAPINRSGKQLPHRLPGPKYSNRTDCSLCNGPEKDQHDEYVCGGCMNLYQDINKNN
jgi:hypothetical protein